MLPPFDMLAESDIERFRRDTFWTKEPETLAWIDSFTDGDIFFDVGANVGVYSLYCAAVHPLAEIAAFEPDAKNFARLKENISRNLFCFIIAHQFAVSNKSGMALFHEASTEVGSTGGQIDSDICDGRACYQVRTVTIDELSEFLGCPQHIKIDIDGQELRVVRGMRRALADPTLRSVLIEVEMSHGDKGGSVAYDTHGQMEIARTFAAAGFTTDNRFNTMTPHSRERRAKEGIQVENVIFTRGL